MTTYSLDNQETDGQFLAWADILSFFMTCAQTLESTQVVVCWLIRALYMKVKWLERAVTIHHC